MEIDYSLMFVTDNSIVDEQKFFHILEDALKGGVSIIQLREKKMTTKSFYNRALKTKKLCSQFKIPLIINDRLDIALAINADGLHIGQQDMPYPVARKLLRKDKIIGLSVSNKNQVINAKNWGVDYIGLSPLFSTTTKTSNITPPLGLKGLVEIRKMYSEPIISIGGINKTNAAEAIKYGSNGIAVISAISKAENPKLETQKLKNIICRIGITK